VGHVEGIGAAVVTARSVAWSCPSGRSRGSYRARAGGAGVEVQRRRPSPQLFRQSSKRKASKQYDDATEHVDVSARTTKFSITRAVLYGSTAGPDARNLSLTVDLYVGRELPARSKRVTDVKISYALQKGPMDRTPSRHVDPGDRFVPQFTGLLDWRSLVDGKSRVTLSGSYTRPRSTRRPRCSTRCRQEDRLRNRRALLQDVKQSSSRITSRRKPPRWRPLRR